MLFNAAGLLCKKGWRIGLSGENISDKEIVNRMSDEQYTIIPNWLEEINQ